jgi:hypothetical protein
VANSEFMVRVAVLVAIALLMTVGVYGLVGAIVKIDDLGLYLSRGTARAARALGNAILRGAPWLMKAISVAGTAAMFLVGGGILVHGIPPLRDAIEQIEESLQGSVGSIAALLFDGFAGVAAGAIVLGAVAVVRRIKGRKASV